MSQHKIFTVVTAVYNVEKYLNDYFQSLVSQTLDFEQHIRLILVNDGSTDTSAKIIKHWQIKYPDNIIYIEKENGGQASARNMGLEYIDTEWVSFIDADDFIHHTYFKTVHHLIERYTDANIAFIGTNLIYYFEKYRLKLNRHPLRYKFDLSTPITIHELDTYIHLSVNNAFFKKEEIVKASLRFDERIKPTFEDSHFTNRYLLHTTNAKAIYAADAHYYYRRRKQHNSTSDTAWSHPGLYNEVLRYGCLHLFHEAERCCKKIPSFIQYTVLYHLSWYYKYFSHDSQSYIIPPYITDLFRELFRFIDLDTIEHYPIGNIDITIREGWRQTYKHEMISFDTITLYRKGNKVQLIHYGTEPVSFEITYDREKLLPIQIGEQYMTFLDSPFVHYYIYRVDLPSRRGTLHIQSKEKTLRLYNGKYMQPCIKIQDIPNMYLKTIKNKTYRFIRNLLLGKSS
jgi:glycosyltransferase involved in cell wall biosynthesis